MAVDWTRSMRQEFEFCEVSPQTWADLSALSDVSACTITHDVGKDTRSSATIAVDGQGWLGAERIVRCYMDATQGGESERVCLGTFSFQGERSERDGLVRSTSADGYGFLQDMASDSPDYGTCAAGDPSEAVGDMVGRSCRAPYVGYAGLAELRAPVWAADGDSWLSFALAVAGEAGCTLDEDAWGRVMLVPDVPFAALRPSWTYGPDNCIVAPRVVDETDLFGIPNWCEVTVSNGVSVRVATAENADPASPTSTVNRGHRIPLRLSNPDGLSAYCTQAQAEAFAARALSDASVVTRTWTYTHAWCPVRAGDAVTLDLGDGSPMVARVMSQDVRLQVGVEVDEVAVTSERTWSA